MNDADNRQTLADAEPAHAVPGGRLAEARQAQNLSPADVARQLKLSVWQVEALEAGRYQQLPGPIFVRGFIRNYARLLKLDPNELLREVAESLPQTAPRPERPPSQEIPFPPAGSRMRWPVVAAAVAVVVGVLAVYEFYWNEPEAPEMQAAAVPAAAVPPAAAGQPAQGESAPAAAQSAGEALAARPAITVATAAQTTQDGPPVGAASAQPDTDSAPRRGERQVRLVFDQESWVEIRDRNEKVIFSQLNRPGTRQSVNGLPPFSIVVGNAHGVRLTYDEKTVDLERHTKIDVARLILQ